MNYASSQGWVSFPIIVLILILVGSSQFFLRQFEKQSQRFWEEGHVAQQQPPWSLFESRVVAHVRDSQAVTSRCLPFCNPFHIEDWNQIFKHNNQIILWRLEHSDNGNETDYRLCAKAFQANEHQCWWLEKNSNRLVARSHLLLMQ